MGRDKKLKVEDSSEKYTKTNFITRRLINNFYRNISLLTDGLEIKNILEIGCGPGFSTSYLSNIFPDKRFEASDYDYKLVKEARRRNPDLNIIQESVYKLKRQTDSVDLIVALEILEHLENPKKAFQELNRVTKKYCLVSVPREPLWRILNMVRGAYWNSLGNTPGHINHWSKKSFTNLVFHYFEIVNVKTPLPWTIVLARK